MKHLKRLGLAVLAAMGLMAFVGAGTASATTLFTSSNLTGAYAAGTDLHFTLTAGKTASFTDEAGNVLITCSGLTDIVQTSNETGTTVSGAISSLVFSGCTTTVDVLANGSLSIEKTGPNEGKVVGSGSQWTYNVFGVSCAYGTGTGTTLGTITGGEAPVLNINGVGLTKVAGGFLCPSKAGWDVSWTNTTPHAFFIGA